VPCCQENSCCWLVFIVISADTRDHIR
jgi:hypothetical protein